MRCEESFCIVVCDVAHTESFLNPTSVKGELRGYSKDDPVMRFIRDHKCVSFIVVLTLLTWLVPSAIAYLDDPPDQHQNGCDPQDRRAAPRTIARPGYAGQVPKIRLTDDGEFIDRCEPTDGLDELNWDWDNPAYLASQRPPIKPGAKSLPKSTPLPIQAGSSVRERPTRAQPRLKSP